MNKKIENISLGMAALFILAIIGLLGFKFFDVVIRMIMKIGLEKILYFGIIGLTSLAALSIVLIAIYYIGAAVNKTISTRC